MGIIIAQLGVWRRYLRIVVSTLVPKVMEYSNMAAPIMLVGVLTQIFTMRKIFDNKSIPKSIEGQHAFLQYAFFIARRLLENNRSTILIWASQLPRNKK
ncbi:MAG: hypothetical protein ACJ718_03655 [Nitrososphaeraceae archaeon]